MLKYILNLALKGGNALDLTPSYIDSLAPNAAAVSNGKGLVKKGSFQNLKITADKTLLFGECAGSGKNPYVCSVDFIVENNPVPRCSCPSRQIPCKHVIGLMYAYVEGKPFAESEVPDDITEKRGAAAKRAENKEKKMQQAKEKPDVDEPPSKAKITAAVKKIDMQLEGLEIAEKLLRNIIQSGLAGIDARARDTLKNQITQLGNYHIKGIQASFSELLLYIKEEDKDFSRSVTQLLYLRALLKKAVEFLNAKKADTPNILKRDVSSEIEEQIDHVWKLEELAAYGRYIQQAEIIQLSFNVYDDQAKKEYVDQGYHICLQDGATYTTRNFRPYNRVKHIKQDDTVFTVAAIEELYIYPGGMNPRVRFDKYTMREIKAEDYKRIQSGASDDFAETAKAVKNQIKTPLADKNPAALLKITGIEQMQNAEEYIQISDSKNNKQLLYGSTTRLMSLIDFKLLKGHVVLVSYENNIETGLLTAKPLSIITDDRIIRLEY
jgi:hypothetical protein